MHSNDRLATVFPFDKSLKIAEVGNITWRFVMCSKQAEKIEMAEPA